MERCESSSSAETLLAAVYISVADMAHRSSASCSTGVVVGIVDATAAPGRCHDNHDQWWGQQHVEVAMTVTRGG